MRRSTIWQRQALVDQSRPAAALRNVEEAARQAGRGLADERQVGDEREAFELEVADVGVAAR